MKKIILAGASSGIGKAIAERMLMANHTVIGLSRTPEKFKPENKNYYSYSADFSKITSLEEKFKTVQKQFPDVDVLICSAGFGEFYELEQFSVSKMQDIMNVNFLSQVILIKTFLASLKKKQFGKIILIGSECALEGQKKGTLYCASKFALRGFTQALRQECRSANISVTLINPGLVNTPFFDGASFEPGDQVENSIQPQQIANLVHMLVMEEFNCVYEEINLQPMKKVLRKKKTKPKNHFIEIC